MQMTKQVVLTGGAAGIGEATAARLLERGHQVVVLDLNEPPAACLQAPDSTLSGSMYGWHRSSPTK